MTIFIDSREDIAISGTTPLDGLEANTGADFMVSRLTIPAKTRSLLMKHIESGAILVQLKVKDDLASSVGDRLNDSLARMRSVTKRTASHWLVYVGRIDMDKEGSALIDGYRTHNSVSYATLSGALVGWLARGGVTYNLPRIDMLDGFVHSLERKLGEYEREQYHYAFNQQDMPDDLDEPLQIPVRVTDARRVLIGFQRLGPELVNRIWSYCGGFKESLVFLTDPQSAGKLEGIGPKTIASIRKQCGLSDGDGYIGWNRDAIAETSVAAEADKLVQEIEQAMKRVRTKAQVDADTNLLFPKHNGART